MKIRKQLTLKNKRLAALSTIISLSLSGQLAPTAFAQTNNEEPKLPTCESTSEANGTVVKSILNSEQGNPKSYAQSASFTLKPSRIKKNIATIEETNASLQITRSDSPNGQATSGLWNKWSFIFPQLIAKDVLPMFEKPGAVGVSIYLDSIENRVYGGSFTSQDYENSKAFKVDGVSKKNYNAGIFTHESNSYLNQPESMQVKEGEPGFEDYQKGIRVLEDHRLKELKKITKWIESDSTEGKLIVRISTEFIGDQYVEFEYDKTDIVRLRLQAEKELLAIEAKHKANECKPYSSDCFLTTASCDTVGLTDNCWELETLRAFRDNWLQHQENGYEDILEYYYTAPKIVEAVNALDNNQTVWLSLYARYIVPCAILIKCGQYKWARKRYTKMMREMATFLEA